MRTLREQIKESFFNPMLYLLPLLAYIVVDDIWDKDTALTYSLPLAFCLVAYVFLRYQKVTVWYLFFATVFLSVAISANIVSMFKIPNVLHRIEVKMVVLAIVAGFLCFKNPIRRIFKRTLPQVLPITNNLNELYLVVWALCYVLTTYVVLYLMIRYFTNHHKALYLQLLQNIFISVVAFLFIYENLRIHIIRAKLLREEWWPIVNGQGKIIGSTQHMTSLTDEMKYLHPVVRVVLINNGMILLQQKESKDIIFPDKWDIVLFNHVWMGENIDQCIERTWNDKFGIDPVKSMYLSNYITETDREFQYAFLFVTTLQSNFGKNAIKPAQTKWWTKQQIMDNMEAGIFTDNFKTEFDLLKRSGLLGNSGCECECTLRSEIEKMQQRRKHA